MTKCELCGEPMPASEEHFKYHGYSGPCPKPHKPVELWTNCTTEDSPFSRGKLMEIWKEHGGSIDRKGRAWIESDLLPAILNSIVERAAPLLFKDRNP